MPFYLYGQGGSLHVDHALLFAPNIQLSGKVSGKFEKQIPEEYLSEGLIAIATNVFERAMQPFPDTKDIDRESFFFGPKRTLDVVLYKDIFPKQTRSPIDVDNLEMPITSGTLTIEGEVYIDSSRLNGDGEIMPSGRMPKEAVDTWVDVVDEFHTKISRFPETFNGITDIGRNPFGSQKHSSHTTPSHGHTSWRRADHDSCYRYGPYKD